MSDTSSDLSFGTLAIHAGVEPEPVTGAIMTPIFQTSTYVQPAVGEPLEGKYDYGRTANPTREALEASIAALESGLTRDRFCVGTRSDRSHREATVGRRSRGQ